MGAITDKNTEELKRAGDFEKADLTDMLDKSFAEEFDKLVLSKGVTTKFVIDNSRISKTYFNELRRRSSDVKRKKISRNLLIEVCLTINAEREELDHILKCASYQPLYARNRADSYILWGYLHGLSGEEIKNGLYERRLWDDI